MDRYHTPHISLAESMHILSHLHIRLVKSRGHITELPLLLQIDTAWNPWLGVYATRGTLSMALDGVIIARG